MPKKIYYNLAAELKRNGLMQKDLAKKLGITAGTITRKLNGSNVITWDEAVKIRNTINSNLDIEYLMKYKVEE